VPNRIEADYYGSASNRLIGAVILQVNLSTNWGRPNEELESLTFRLEEQKEHFAVGEIEF
jgi:hypothetical protein